MDIVLAGVVPAVPAKPTGGAGSTPGAAAATAADVFGEVFRQSMGIADPTVDRAATPAGPAVPAGIDASSFAGDRAETIVGFLSLPTAWFDDPAAGDAAPAAETDDTDEVSVEMALALGFVEMPAQTNDVADDTSVMLGMLGVDASADADPSTSVESASDATSGVTPFATPTPAAAESTPSRNAPTVPAHSPTLSPSPSAPELAPVESTAGAGEGTDPVDAAAPAPTSRIASRGTSPIDIETRRAERRSQVPPGAESLAVLRRRGAEVDRTEMALDSKRGAAESAPAPTTPFTDVLANAQSLRGLEALRFRRASANGDVQAPPVSARDVPIAGLRADSVVRQAVQDLTGDLLHVSLTPAPAAQPTAPSVTVTSTPLPADATPRLATTAPATAPAAASSIATPATTDALPGAAAHQIVQAMRLQLQRGGGEAHIRLDPAYLGGVNIAIRVDGQQVAVRLDAETATVRDWLHAQQHVLRQALADQNLTLDRLEIREPPADTSRRDREDSHDGDRQPRDQRRQRPRGDDATFHLDV